MGASLSRQSVATQPEASLACRRGNPSVRSVDSESSGQAIEPRKVIEEATAVPCSRGRVGRSVMVSSVWFFRSSKEPVRGDKGFCGNWGEASHLPLTEPENFSPTGKCRSNRDIPRREINRRAQYMGGGDQCDCTFKSPIISSVSQKSSDAVAAVLRWSSQRPDPPQPSPASLDPASSCGVA